MTATDVPEGAGTSARPLFDASFVNPKDRRLVLVAAVFGSSMGFIDGTVTAIAMPAIRASLGASLADAQWINNAYMVALAALILTGGAFADRFGLARVFSLGIMVFIAMSLVCAVAPNAQTLIAARFAQGIGAALMVPGSLAIVSRAYPREDRAAAIGTWAAYSALTTALGPIIGGLALSFGGPDIWRWIFAINLPMGLAALWMIHRGVTRDAARPDQPVDVIGALLATTALGLLAWAMISAEGGANRPTSLLAAIGLAAFTLFLIHEARTSAPMMPLTLFRSRLFAAANGATFLLYFCLSAIMFYLPMLVIAAWDVSAIEAAAAFAPLSVFIALFSKRFGALADRIGPAPVVALGSATIAAGYGWLAISVAGQTYYADVLPPMSLAGLGMSMVVAPLSTAVMAAVSDRQTGLASGVNNAISRAAGLTAVAALGGIISRSYTEAGGNFAYGIAADGAAHATAMTAAFSSLAWITCATALLAALVAATMGRQAP
ncbi:DHA2 family efflux MFS transporter permease subunit [Octadecabacter sp.]|nr:DHA2 family efflux MFS transporter permease subunit [Octadecabacter sp.]